MTHYDVCNDNRSEIIAKAKDKLIKETNITDAPEEMAVLDDILFRMWQMKMLQSEPCEDTISRQAVLNLINEDWKYEGLEKPVKWLPSVTPTRKKGKWIKLRDRYDEPYEVCSLCNCSGIGVFNYCPNCGAEMESE